MKDLGKCSICGQAIKMLDGDAEAHHKALLAAMDTVVLDEPVYKTQMITPVLPLWPCGHTITIVKQCYKRSDGKFEYSL